MPERERKRRWETYLEGVKNYRRKQWGDNFTLMAISGILRRMVLVCSVGPSQTLSKFEIEPPDHWDRWESLGVPMILGHYGAHHYLPVKIKRDGPWGWVMSTVIEGKEVVRDGMTQSPKDLVDGFSSGKGQQEEAQETKTVEPTSSRKPLSQRRLVSVRVDTDGDVNEGMVLDDGHRRDGSFQGQPVSSRTSSPQRRLELDHSERMMEIEESVEFQPVTSCKPSPQRRLVVVRSENDGGSGCSGGESEQKGEEKWRAWFADDGKTDEQEEESWLVACGIKSEVEAEEGVAGSAVIDAKKEMGAEEGPLRRRNGTGGGYSGRATEVLAELLHSRKAVGQEEEVGWAGRGWL